MVIGLDTATIFLSVSMPLGRDAHVNSHMSEVNQFFFYDAK